MTYNLQRGNVFLKTETVGPARISGLVSCISRGGR